MICEAEKNRTRNNKFVFVAICLLVFILFFLIFYKLVRPMRADYSYHVYEIYNDDWIGPKFTRHNNTFRYFLDICHYFSFDLKTSAATILSFFVLIRFISFYFIIKDSSLLKKTLLSLSFCIMMTMDFGSLSNVYSGTFVGNIWHNPTYIAMLAFTPGCIYYFIEVFINEQKTKKNYYLLSLFILLCCFSKPSFVIAYIPACALFYVIDYFIYHKNIKELFSNIEKGLAVCIPTFVLLGIGYVSEWGGGDSNYVFVHFLGVWLVFAGSIKSIILNFIRSFFISFILLFVNNKSKKKIYYLLFMIIGLLYWSLFAETVRYNDANFAWTYGSCGLMFNCFILLDYFNENHKNKIIKYVVIISIILQCLTSGRYLYALINDLL